MNDFLIKATASTPEIYFSPSENRFHIKGISSPEDVRELYYPVIDWMKSFMVSVNKENPYTIDDPLVLKIDLDYFNSSSAKFLYDILMLLRELRDNDIPVEVIWYYDSGDIDNKEAGEDISLLCEIPFTYRPKIKPVS